MTRVCAWCQCSLPDRPGDDPEDKRTSHGICPECARREIENDRKSRETEPAQEER